jgi:hypothetical protein
MLPRDIRRIIKKRKEPQQKDKEKSHRSPFLYYGSIIILVVVTISFIGVPVVSRIGRNGARLVFGSYSGRDIAYIRGNYLADQYENIADRIRKSDQGGTLETQLWQAWRYAFEQTVLHFAILDVAQKSGVWVSDDRVTDSLVESGPYTVNRAFSHEKYDATPRAERNAISKLRRETLIHAKYLQDLFLAEMQSPKEREFIKNMARVERRFSFVSYSFEDFPIEKTLSYGLANRDKFRKIKVSRITITSNRNEAEKVREMAIAGESSFADLARSYSKGYYADKGGDMGWQYYYQLQVLFESEEPLQAIFSLREGDISEIFESGSSWVFFRCDSEPVSPDFKEEGLLDTVKDYVLSNEKGVIEAHFMAEAEAFRKRAQEIGFNKASIEKGLFPPNDTEYFPINYMETFQQRRLLVRGQKDSPIFASAANNEDFFLKLFSLKEGEVSEPILLSDNILVMVLLDERERSEEDLESLDPYIDFMTSSSLERDLQSRIIDEDKLVDNFQETFFRYILPQQ